VTDCPNCGAQVEDGVRLCPRCGFDTRESQAEDVRALREAGEIHPGRLGAEGAEDPAGAGAAGADELPSEGPSDRDPRETQGGL
jgi:zinc ribbon protein